MVRNDRLGDALLALPTVTALIQKYPNQKLSFWVSPDTALLIQCVEGIDRVFAAPDNESKALVTPLRQAGLKTAYCLRPTLPNALTLFRAGIPERIGTARRWYSALFNQRINIRRRGASLHEADLNLLLAGFDPSEYPPRFPPFNLPVEAEQRVDKLLSERGLDVGRPFLLIHPGSGGSARNWAADHFRTLANLLAKVTGKSVVVTGGAAEKALTAHVAGGIHFDFADAFNLVELACLLRRAALVLSNSTGPLHLAAALGTKVLGLYAPVADGLPERWGPYGQPEGALKPDLPLCHRCVPGEFSSCRCMENLTPETVLERCLQILSLSR